MRTSPAEQRSKISAEEEEAEEEEDVRISQKKGIQRIKEWEHRGARPVRHVCAVEMVRFFLFFFFIFWEV